jgi:hypothetical protein
MCDARTGSVRRVSGKRPARNNAQVPVQTPDACSRLRTAVLAALATAGTRQKAVRNLLCCLPQPGQAARPSPQSCFWQLASTTRTERQKTSRVPTPRSCAASFVQGPRGGVDARYLGDSFSRVGSPRGPRQARPRQKLQCFAVVEVTIRNLTVRQQHRRTKLEWTEQRETINYDEARLYSPASPSPLSTDIFYVTVSFIDERFLRS